MAASTMLRVLSALSILALVQAQAGCNIFLDPNCAKQQAGATATGNTKPSFQSKKCNYENQKFFLIPQEADNSTCAQPSVIAKGIKIAIHNDSIEISPKTVVLPSCFSISFTMEIMEEISKVPKSMLAHNEFQLYEFPEIEKMQCQNASNNGCGGYGNNCYYCDLCESLIQLDKNASAKNDRVQSQFANLKCPNKPGQKFQVKREFCFNDWAELDKDNNCKLDFLEEIAKDSQKDYDTLHDAIDVVNNKGYSTLLARFYLAHNETDEQIVKRQAKEKEIETHVDAQLNAKRAAGWQITDADFKEFRGWHMQNEKDKWHKEKYLPWVLFENELACLKVSFTVCDKEPVKKTGTGDETVLWSRKGLNSELKCP